MWLSPGILVFPTNKTDNYDIAEILSKVVLNTFNRNPNPKSSLKLLSLAK
jgi:uncharacterized protein (DUF2132 family)